MASHRDLNSWAPPALTDIKTIAWDLQPLLALHLISSSSSCQLFQDLSPPHMELIRGRTRPMTTLLLCTYLCFFSTSALFSSNSIGDSPSGERYFISAKNPYFPSKDDIFDSKLPPFLGFHLFFFLVFADTGKSSRTATFIQVTDFFLPLEETLTLSANLVGSSVEILTWSGLISCRGKRWGRWAELEAVRVHILRGAR